MAKVDPPSNPEEMQKRREPRWIIDPKTVTQEEQNRLLRWARAKAKQYVGKMNFEVPNGAIIADGDVEPEEPDIGPIYGFSDLHWIIYREGLLFSFVLFSRKVILLKIGFGNDPNVK